MTNHGGSWKKNTRLNNKANLVLFLLTIGWILCYYTFVVVAIAVPATSSSLKTINKNNLPVPIVAPSIQNQLDEEENNKNGPLKLMKSVGFGLYSFLHASTVGFVRNIGQMRRDAKRCQMIRTKINDYCQSNVEAKKLDKRLLQNFGKVITFDEYLHLRRGKQDRSKLIQFMFYTIFLPKVMPYVLWFSPQTILPSAFTSSTTAATDDETPKPNVLLAHYMFQTHAITNVLQTLEEKAFIIKQKSSGILNLFQSNQKKQIQERQQSTTLLHQIQTFLFHKNNHAANIGPQAVLQSLQSLVFIPSKSSLPVVVSSTIQQQELDDSSTLSDQEKKKLDKKRQRQERNELLQRQRLRQQQERELYRQYQSLETLEKIPPILIQQLVLCIQQLQDNNSKKQNQQNDDTTTVPWPKTTNGPISFLTPRFLKRKTLLNHINELRESDEFLRQVNLSNLSTLSLESACQERFIYSTTTTTSKRRLDLEHQLQEWIRYTTILPLRRINVSEEYYCGNMARTIQMSCNILRHVLMSGDSTYLLPSRQIMATSIVKQKQKTIMDENNNDGKKTRKRRHRGRKQQQDDNNQQE